MGVLLSREELGGSGWELGVKQMGLDVLLGLWETFYLADLVINNLTIHRINLQKVIDLKYTVKR